MNFDKVECIQKIVTRMGLKIMSIMSSEKWLKERTWDIQLLVFLSLSVYLV